MDGFEVWLLQRVAQGVEAGKVSGDLLTQLYSKIERAGELPQEEGHVLAVQDTEDQLGLALDQFTQLFTALLVQPSVTRELLMRRIASAGDERHAR